MFVFPIPPCQVTLSHVRKSEAGFVTLTWYHAAGVENSDNWLHLYLSLQIISRSPLQQSALPPRLARANPRTFLRVLQAAQQNHFWTI